MMEVSHDMPDGKKLIVREVNAYTSKLFIKGSRTIEIGTLDKTTGILTVFKNRGVHEHHNTKSYGFNSWLLRNSKHIKTVTIYEDNEGYNNTYSISKEALINGGREMNFIGEKQIFFPIYQLETFYKTS